MIKVILRISRVLISFILTTSPSWIYVLLSTCTRPVGHRAKHARRKDQSETHQQTLTNSDKLTILLISSVNKCVSGWVKKRRRKAKWNTRHKVRVLDSKLPRSALPCRCFSARGRWKRKPKHTAFTPQTARALTNPLSCALFRLSVTPPALFNTQQYKTYRI